jgi:hypothetical protein
VVVVVVDTRVQDNIAKSILQGKSWLFLFVLKQVTKGGMPLRCGAVLAGMLFFFGFLRGI